MEDPLPDPTNILINLVVLLALIFFNALLVMGETAIVALNESKIRKSAEEGDKKAARVLKLLESPAAFISSIQIATTVLGFLLSAWSALNFAIYPISWLVKIVGAFHINALYINIIYIISVVIIALVSSFLFLLLGNLIPKGIALHKGEKLAFRLAGFLLFIRAIIRPFAWLLSALSHLVLRLLGIDPDADQEHITEEEILMMVDEGEEKGVIEESQKEMINNIFEFDDITAGSVMTHRTDIVAVDIRDTLDDVLKAAINEGYSRIPVYEDDLDNIKGILYVKDLLPLVGRQIYDRTIRSIMREVRFVPESKRCGDLFREMTESRIQMVIISDEYGGVAGLLTIEDLLESIVGNIRDEYDQDEEEEVERVNETTITVDGTTDISDIEEELGVDLPDGEYDTIGGFIMSELGRIPKEGETPEIESTGFKFTVVEVDERRIERIKIEKLETEAAETE